MWCRARVVGGHATIGRLSNNDFSTFQAIRKIFLKKVAERSRDSGRRSRDRRPTVKQRFFDVSSDLGKFWKKSLNGHATVVGGHATVGRLSNNVFWTFQAIWENFEKSRWTVTRQWSEVTRPSADCQTTFFGRFKRFGKILKKVAERSRDSGRRSRDRRPTVKQRFLDVSSDLGKFWKKSLNGHATVVGGHATVGRLSNNVFWTFQAIREIFEKSRWTVTRQWSEVTRPSADCQTTFFGRFKRFGKILKKVAERSRDSGRRSRDRRPTVKQRFLDVSSDLGKFWKKSLNGHATVVGGHATVGRLSNNVFWTFQAIWENFEKSRWTVTRQWSRSRDRRPTVKQRFWTFQAIRKFWKKSLNGHATVVGGHATVGWLSNNVFWTFQAIWENFEKSRWTVTRQWLRSRDRRPTVKQRFLDVSSDLGKFWKKSLNGHATVVGGHATVGRLSNNVFWTFQAIWENFEKSRWTVTRQWLRSRDRRPTVKQRFLDVSSDLGKFWKKSLNGHATVVGGHATVGRLSNNVFWTFQAIWENFEKSRWTVTRQWSEVTRPSADCQTTFFGRFKRFGKILKKVAERSRDSGRRSRDRRPTVKQRFLDVSSGKILKKVWTVTRQWSGHATVGWLSNNVFGRFKQLGNFL